MVYDHTSGSQATKDVVIVTSSNSFWVGAFITTETKTRSHATAESTTMPVASPTMTYLAKERHSKLPGLAIRTESPKTR
jgi:hypothetical protein